jgi:hypothetical protein
MEGLMIFLHLLMRFLILVLLMTVFFKFMRRLLTDAILYLSSFD